MIQEGIRGPSPQKGARRNIVLAHHDPIHTHLHEGILHQHTQRNDAHLAEQHHCFPPVPAAGNVITCTKCKARQARRLLYQDHSVCLTPAVFFRTFIQEAILGAKRWCQQQALPDVCVVALVCQSVVKTCTTNARNGAGPTFCVRHVHPLAQGLPCLGVPSLRQPSPLPHVHRWQSKPVRP